MKTLALTASLALAASAFSATTLTVGELESQGAQSATVPVEFRSDTSVAAVQMVVLFDPAAYTATTALAGSQAESFRVDSHLLEPGQLSVVVGSPNNAALANGTVFRVPLNAVDEFASFFPVVLTEFRLATADGAAVAGKIAPRVRLLGLTSGGKINGTGGVTLFVESGATDGNVARVEFFAGGVKIGESTGSPFNILWTPPGSGPFTISAIAYDSNGLQTESRSIPIVVTNVGTAAVKGLYAGLLTDTPFAFETNGYAQFSTTAKGGFSVKVFLGGKTFSGGGKFGADGTATVRFKRGKTESPLTLTLQQYATNLVDQISGQLTDGTLNGAVVENATFVSNLSADRAIWKSKTNEPAERGSYTVVMPSTETGSSVGVATVSNKGTIASVFSLADGTKASQGTFLSKNGEWPLFASLYKNKGVLTGLVNFTEEPSVSDFDGTVNWTRPSASTAELAAVGSRYDAPEKFERMLNLANLAGNAVLTADTATPLDWLFTINSANVATPLTTNGVSLKLTPKTGAMSGAFIPPGETKPTKFTGVVFQKQNMGEGYFPGGTISLASNPDYTLPAASHAQGVKPLPSLTFKSPKDKTRIAEPAAIDIAGVAKAKAPLASVSYQVLHDGILSPAQTATGTENWTVQFTPTTGAGGDYKFFVKATDNAQHESDVVSRTVFYVVPSPLTVNISGPGTVSNGFVGTTTRDIGATYTLTAKPQRGHTFTDWTGSITSTAESITFKMTAGFAIQANFQ